MFGFLTLQAPIPQNDQTHSNTQMMLVMTEAVFPGAGITESSHHLKQ